ncbi:immunoglobulin lambda-1 light chain-like [Fundulus heteroclitus]|uniref:immunoglobulin lambda-1 light chain-like n=1 Tax=Fundulus heteroclitus TaxID=8078 RepID=UPI00165A43B2|nr:immunoglobulin lambda-1 light chain-like [Fundulus heteroclitus]
MDLLILKSLVFPLCFIGHSVGQNVAVVGPPKAYLGENVTLKILVEKKQDDIIYWNFKSGNFMHVATLRETNLTVNDRYKGRASIDSASGELTLTSVKLEDSGNYAVNILSGPDTLTGTVRLLVVDVVHPTLTLQPPSVEQLQQEKFTLVCLAHGGLPSDWRLHWIINSTSQVEWEEEWSPEMLQEDKSYSWRSSITITVENWKRMFSLTCTARLGSLAPISITLKTDQSSEAQSDSLDGS